MTELPNNLHAYIDGDVIKYRCAFAAEKTKYLITFLQDGYHAIADLVESKKDALAVEAARTEELGDLTIWQSKEIQPVEFALQATKTCLESLLGNFPSYTIYVSGSSNFRDSIAVTRPYKGNRDRTKDPVYKKDVEEYLIREYGAVRTDGIEADDAIGIALTGNPNGCAVTNDKDLDQVAGWHYNFVSGAAHKVSPRNADFSLYTQLLTGDSTDNIPGLEGVGAVTAREILNGSKSSLDLAQRAWRAYRDRIDGFEACKAYFIEQLTLVFILRDGSVGDGEALLNLPKGFEFT